MSKQKPRARQIRSVIRKAVKTTWPKGMPDQVVQQGASVVIPDWAQAAAKHAGMPAETFWAAHQAEKREPLKWSDITAPLEALRLKSPTTREQWDGVKARLHSTIDQFDQSMGKDDDRAIYDSLIAELTNIATEAKGLLRQCGW